MSSQDWKTLLRDGEDIVWQGRPDGAVTFEASQIFKTGFGVLFAGFALFWMIIAASAGGGFWMFGLIHFSVGAGMVIWTIFGPAFRRRRTWYTLSNRRAFIATDMPIGGRSLKSFPISEATSIDFRAAPLPSIMFATETKRGKNRTYEVPVGFERIADADDVLGHIHKIQQGDT